MDAWPIEERAGGARAMQADGLFERFPRDAFYGLRNRPGLDRGRFAIGPGAFMAGRLFRHCHHEYRRALEAARNERGLNRRHDSIPLESAPQGIVAHKIPLFEPAVLSITTMTGGNAYDGIPSV